MSEYNARTGVKRLRVRGRKAVRFCAILKASGINIFRATAVRKAVSFLMATSERQPAGLGRVFLVFKEQFETIWGRLRNTVTPPFHVTISLAVKWLRDFLRGHQICVMDIFIDKITGGVYKFPARMNGNSNHPGDNG